MSDVYSNTVTISDLVEIIDDLYSSGMYSDLGNYALYRLLHDLLTLATIKSEKKPYKQECIGKPQSNKEKVIAKFLMQKGFTPYHNVIKKDCIGDKSYLPFDFGIIVNGKELLIEYDGEQHFKPIRFFGGVEHFAQIKRHDDIKTEYCQKNGIPLLRLNSESNIKKELSRFISKYEQAC